MRPRRREQVPVVVPDLEVRRRLVRRNHGHPGAVPDVPRIRCGVDGGRGRRSRGCSIERERLRPQPCSFGADVRH